MADSCHLDFLKKDQLFRVAILAYHITSLTKAIYEKKTNVTFRRLKSKCDTYQGCQSSHEMYSQKIWEDWEDKKNIDMTVNIP